MPNQPPGHGLTMVHGQRAYTVNAGWSPKNTSADSV
jgi:hypothetical protein